MFTIKRKTCSRPTVTREDLAEETLGLANRIAQRDPYGLMMAKRLVNEAMDLQGFTRSAENAFK